MDWRALSRSRSRISMDWRPTSRSRSRPPEVSGTFDQHGMLTGTAYDGRFVFPTSHDSFKVSDNITNNKQVPVKSGISTSLGIPIPGAGSSVLSFGRRTPPYNMLFHLQSELTSVYEDQSETTSSGCEKAESQYLHPASHNHAPLILR